jgi:flagellin
MTLLNILNRTSTAQNNTMRRLATAHRINRGADDPAGLIAVNMLQHEIVATEAALSNNQRTDSILTVADGAISEINSLLAEVQSLAVASANSAGLSASEIAANQAQVDSAIASIDRIISTTEFGGKKLLNGTFSIQTSSVDGSDITDVRVFSRNSASSSTSLQVDVTSAAEQAQLASYATTSATTDTTISIQGELGTVVIEISAGENLSSIASKINDATGATGVTASTNGGNTQLHLSSAEHGSDAFVQVTNISGDSTNFGTDNDDGVDATVTVNGQTTVVDGLEVHFSSGDLSLTFNLTDSFNQSTGDSTFSVDAGGATFQLGSSSSTRATIGVGGLFTHQLGSSELGYLNSLKSGGANSLVNNPAQASLIAKAASGQVAQAQGRIGGFQRYQVGSAIGQLNAAREGLSAAVSFIRDTDFALETAALSRQSVLMESAILLLGITNQQQSQVLSLLG